MKNNDKNNDGDKLDKKVKKMIADPVVHRRILETINDAVRAEDLLVPIAVVAHAEDPLGAPDENDHGDLPPVPDPERLAQLEIAATILKFRDECFPLGLRHVNELAAKEPQLYRQIPELFFHLNHTALGEWDDFPITIPRRGPGNYNGVVHAALCHTGKVLFITADETTMLWDPLNTAATTFEDPTNQPHLMTDGYSQLCGHHVFLSSGDLLSVGGGGYGSNALALAGYVFDPTNKTWTRTANNMGESKWYPTAVALGDERVLVTCGNRGGHMEIYKESTNSFTAVSGDDNNFPNLYPGLHLLPSHSVFYTRTGWGSAGSGGSPTNDAQSAYFSLTVPNGGTTGSWNNIQNAIANRTKGMSVLLMSSAPPYVQVMVIGGVGGDQGTYEIADVTSLSGATSWGPATPFSDGINRSLASAVLLPTGDVFVAGGTTTTNSACALYNPSAGTWSAMANLPSVRNYHSVAILLPSGKVMMAGWNNTTIEIYSPPYIFATRPSISSAPTLVHHGREFAISTPDAEDIVKAVLVRPMAVTHQTDSEQKVIEMANRHDHTNPSDILATAPDSAHPHSNAQKGYYLLFIINLQGVPSEGRWIYLH